MDLSKWVLVFAVLYSISIAKAFVIEKRLENRPSWEKFLNQPEMPIDDNVDRQVFCGINFNCLNGGTCDDSSGNPKCRCRAANYGERCENTERAPPGEPGEPAPPEESMYRE